MADKMPNYHVEQQRLKAQIAQQRATIESQRYEILQMVDRRDNYLANIAAAEKAIADYEGKLADLAKTHGQLTDQKLKDMTKSLET